MSSLVSGATKKNMSVGGGADMNKNARQIHEPQVLVKNTMDLCRVAHEILILTGENSPICNVNAETATNNPGR